MHQGKLFVFSGPSGAGKSTICENLTKDGEYKLSISMTTRAPRGAEQNGISYYFVSKEEFQKTIDEDGFLEHAEIYGNCYGTPKKPVMDCLAKGQDVILEIEMQGAMMVKKSYPDAILVFVLPPSLDVLKNHLRGRGTENEEQLALRLKTSLEEIHLLKDYDFYLVNDKLEKAIEDAKTIIRSSHLKVAKDADEVIKKYEEEK